MFELELLWKIWDTAGLCSVLTLAMYWFFSDVVRMDKSSIAVYAVALAFTVSMLVLILFSIWIPIVYIWS